MMKIKYKEQECADGTSLSLSFSGKIKLEDSSRTEEDLQSGKVTCVPFFRNGGTDVVICPEPDIHMSLDFP